jgi:hypothetical protein
MAEVALLIREERTAGLNVAYRNTAGELGAV